jgi:hypothetical protein
VSENGQAPNNPFGLGPNGSSGFKSIADAVAKLGEALDKYFDKWHETTVSALWSGNGWKVDPKKPWITTQPPAYCVGGTPAGIAGCQATGKNISNFLKSEGGDPNSLLFPCKD